MTDATSCCSTPDPAPSRRARFAASLQGLPRWVGPVVLLGALVLGLVVGGPVGAVLLGFVTLALVATLALTWRSASPQERAARLAAVVFVYSLAAVRLVP